MAKNVNLAYHSMHVQDTSFQISIETAYDPSLGWAAEHNLGEVVEIRIRLMSSGGQVIIPLNGAAPR